MTDIAPAGPSPSPLPQVGKVYLSELITSLSMGWQDFASAPRFGLFFSAVYVVAGLALVGLGAGEVAWVLMIGLGFPLVAPFAAVGLYEVSRRLEAREPLTWGAVLGVVAVQRRRQIPWIGAVIVIGFLFWTFLAQMIFALFIGPSEMAGISGSLDAVFTASGLILIAVELAVGGGFALLLYALTVVSLPLLLEKEVDFITAMRLSLAVVRANRFVMLVWAAVIAGLLLAGMLPAFLGLFVVLPVLGHASWHLYRRALYDPV